MVSRTKLNKKESQLKDSVTKAQLETVFSDSTYLFTGVAASHDGKRLFVSYPNWTDKHLWSVVEVGSNGKATAYPNAKWNSFKKGDDGANRFVCVQAVFADDKGYLWVVDPAGIGLGDVYQQSNKVVKINLHTDSVERIYRFPANVAGPKSYINDIRIDNENGFAYLTSSADGGIVVLNINSGASRLVLSKHPSVLSDTAYHFIIDGKEWTNAKGPVKINADGIALTPDKAWLYYKPLTDDKLSRISTALLRNFKTSDKDIEVGVENLGRFITTDGMEFDASGNLYLGDLEKYSIVRMGTDKKMTTLIGDRNQLIWPDSYSISNGYLYISCSQIQWSPLFNNGKTINKLPYRILRMKLN